MKKIILAVVLFLPFLVSCSQNRKAPAVSPQTTVGKSEKTETAKVQYLTTSDFRKKIMDYEAIVLAKNIFDKTIIPVNINEIAEYGGLLNCISWED